MSLIELACHDASCAPPPIGTGGSKPSGGGIPEGLYRGIPKKHADLQARAIAVGQEIVALAKTKTGRNKLTKHLGAVGTELGFEDRPAGAWQYLVMSVDGRSGVSRTLRDPKPLPFMVEMLRIKHEEIEREMAGETWTFSRRMRATESGVDPFHPTDGPYSFLRKTEGGGTGVTSWWTPRSAGMTEAWQSYYDDMVTVDVGADRVLGRIGDMNVKGEVLVANSPDVVARLKSGTFPIVPPENLVSSLIELACHTAECAPPPTGTGGSSPDGALDDVEDLPEGFVTDGEDAAKRVFEFEFTDREGRKFIAKTNEVEESDAGVVTIEGTIFAPVPIGGGRLRQHAVGYFTRQVDGWRMHHDSLSVMPQHQGKGIGSAFIAESMRRAADEGVTLVSTSALSTKTSNGVYTWLRAGFDTPTGMVTARTTRNKLGARYRTAGDDTLATRLRGRNPVSTADLLASPVAKQALGGMPEGGNAVQMELQMNISDLRTEAALAASIFTDWVERAITFTLAEDETWYEPLADEDLTAAGCQSADCAPPPTGTGGSKPGNDKDRLDEADARLNNPFTATEPEGDSGEAVVGVPFADLPSSAKGAVLQWVSEGDVIDPAEHVNKFVYDVEVLPIEEAKRRAMQVPDIAADFGDDWAAYHAAYMALVPDDPRMVNPPGERWGVITSPYSDEFIIDGWHRLHRFVRDGEDDITVVQMRPKPNPFATVDAPGELGYASSSKYPGMRPVTTDERKELRVEGRPYMPGVVDWVDGYEIEGTLPVFDPDSAAGKRVLELANRDMVMQGEVIVGRPGLVQRLLNGEPSDEANAALAASADPFAGLEVYGFACRSKECAPPPVGKGGSSPGVGTSAEALFALAAEHEADPRKAYGTDARRELKRQAGLIFNHSIKYGYRSEVSYASPMGGNAISVHGDLLSKKGKRIGEFKFVLFKDSSGTWADFDIVVLKRDYIGKGIGGRFYVRTEEGLRNAGFNRIELHAANNSGHQLGYLRGASNWGRFGYDWDQRHLGDVLELRSKESRRLSPSYTIGEAGLEYSRKQSDGSKRFMEFADRIQEARRVGEPYTLRDDDPTPAEVFELDAFRYTDNIGWHGVKTLTPPATTAAASPSRQARLDAIAAFYMGAARDAETDDLPDMPESLLAACHDASCAPPPIGTGGSTPGADDGIPGIADQEAYDQYRETTSNIRLLDVESAAYAQQQVQDAEVVVRISADRLSDIVNYSEPEDWELRSMHDPENEVGRSLRGEEYLKHRDLYDAAVGLDMGYVVHGYSEAEFSLEPIVDGSTDINHRVSPLAATWYGEIQLVMSDEARDDATFTIADSLNSGSVPLPVEGPIDPRAAALNGVHPFQMGRDYVEVQLRSPIELSSKHVKEVRVPDLHYLQDVAHVLAERMPDTLVTIEDDGIQMSMKNAVKALEEIS
jgi:GNAT superfamily N-acetyltransferase